MNLSCPFPGIDSSWTVWESDPTNLDDPSSNYCGSLLSLSGNSMMLSDVSAETDAGSGATGTAWGNSVQNPTRWHIRVTDREKYPHFGP